MMPNHNLFAMTNGLIFNLTSSIVNGWQWLLRILIILILAIAFMLLSAQPVNAFADEPTAVNITYGELDGQDYSDQDLTGSVFAASSMRKISFRNSNLTSAIMTEGILLGADLRGAELAHANLTDADLRDVSLAGADLSNAILPNGAVMPDRAIIQRTKVISHITKDTPVNHTRANSIYQYCQ